MANPQKRRGDQAEREVAAILNDLLGVTCQRMLGAGRKEDVGDIFGVPDTTVQVANYRNLNAACRIKLPELERQRERSGTTFAAMFLRRVGGSYVVCMTPEMFAALWREAAAPTPTMRDEEEGVAAWPI